MFDEMKDIESRLLEAIECGIADALNEKFGVHEGATELYRQLLNKRGEYEIVDRNDPDYKTIVTDPEIIDNEFRKYTLKYELKNKTYTIYVFYGNFDERSNDRGQAFLKSLTNLGLEISTFDSILLHELRHIVDYIIRKTRSSANSENTHML